MSEILEYKGELDTVASTDEEYPTPIKYRLRAWHKGVDVSLLNAAGEERAAVLVELSQNVENGPIVARVLLYKQDPEPEEPGAQVVVDEPSSYYVLFEAEVL